MGGCLILASLRNIPLRVHCTMPYHFCFRKAVEITPIPAFHRFRVSPCPEPAEILLTTSWMSDCQCLLRLQSTEGSNSGGVARVTMDSLRQRQLSCFSRFSGKLETKWRMKVPSTSSPLKYKTAKMIWSNNLVKNQGVSRRQLCPEYTSPPKRLKREIRCMKHSRQRW